MADDLIEKEQNNLEKIYAEAWPEYLKQTRADFELWPEELKNLKSYFNKASLYKIELKGGITALLLTEDARKERMCPPFSDQIGRGFNLYFKKQQSSLTHYEFVNRTQKLMIETRKRAFYCEIEILLKNRYSNVSK